MYWWELPLSILFSGLNCHSFFSLFSRPSIIFKVLNLIIFGNSIFLLHWGAQTWTHNSSCGLTSAEERKDHFPQPYGNTPPSAAQDIAIHLCLRDLLLLNWESIRCPRSFPAKLPSSQWAHVWNIWNVRECNSRRKFAVFRRVFSIITCCDTLNR